MLDRIFFHFTNSFYDHKELLVLVLALVFLTLTVSWWAYDTSDIDQVYEDAYLEQETTFDFLDFILITGNNVFLNIFAYVMSIFFGIGAIADILVNIGVTGSTSAATAYFTGDSLYFIKLTLVHGFYEDVSTILNSFASFILASAVLKYVKDFLSPSKQIADSRLKNAWELNKVDFKESFAVFLVGIAVMIFAGFLEVYISIPIGNLLVEIL